MSQIADELDALARSLEAAVPLATTRIEHVRVSGHAYTARSLAEKLRATETPAPFEVTHSP